jgi:hypothetical protein
MTRTLVGESSILHKPACPLCKQDWTGLLNDLERLAHLTICAGSPRIARN